MVFNFLLKVLCEQMPGLGVNILETSSNPPPPSPHHPPPQSSCQAGGFVPTVGRCQHNRTGHAANKGRMNASQTWQ